MKTINLLFATGAMLFIMSCNNQRAVNETTKNMKNNEISVQYLSPEGLPKNPAYSQAIVVSGAAKTIYVGGQNSVDQSGAIVGKGDFKAQTEQTLKNLKTVLEAAGAKPENVIKWNIYVVQGQSFKDGFEAFQKVWGKQPNPAITTGVYVAGLSNPDFLVEIEAVAIVP